MRSIGSEDKKSKLSTLFRLFLYSFLLSPASCYRVPPDITPKVNYTVHERYLKQLPSPFTPLGPLEKESDWGKEYLIGIHFAHNLDLYRAITAFRRAEILLGDPNSSRTLEMQYEILLCYYLGKRYSEIETAFTKSRLAQVNTDFPAFHDLLLILYDSYEQLNEPEKASQILELILHHYPETYNTLSLSSALRRADLPTLDKFTQHPPDRPYLQASLDTYYSQRKSPGTARFLNAILPGAGYLYVGQKQTAVTAFLVNGLFIAASIHFFRKGPIAAGIVTTSLEAGWYVGGIQGAGLEAKFYNERLYENTFTPVMNREKLFPVFMLNHSF